MALTLAEKILQAHIVKEACPHTEFTPGTPIQRGADIAIRIDQTLTQDATGTMTYLQFETIGIPRVRTELSVSYIEPRSTSVRTRCGMPPRAPSSRLVPRRA